MYRRSSSLWQSNKQLIIGEDVSFQVSYPCLKI